MQQDNDIYVKLATHFQNKSMLSLEVSDLQVKLQILALEAMKNNLMTVQTLSKLTLVQGTLEQETAKLIADLMKELNLPDHSMEKYKEFFDINKIQERAAQVEKHHADFKALLDEIQELRKDISDFTSSKKGDLEELQKGVKEVKELFDGLSK